jgi:K+-transporting ATPase ATPase A chain
MSGTNVSGIVFVASLTVALIATYRPFGDYMAKVFTSEKHTRVELAVYRVGGIDPDADQTWGVYLRSVLAFAVVGVLFLYAFLRIQHFGVFGHNYAGGTSPPKMDQSQSFNTAASFVTNTNWQSYSGENALGYVVQMAGLAVQNFISAAMGIAVAIALVRGFARNRTNRVGNFWVDLTRTCFRILLPVVVLMAIVFIAAGAIQTFHGYRTATTVAGGQQVLPGGPYASQEAIKMFGTNGGGTFNANSAHPFSNPTAWTNWLQIYLLLAIGFSLPRTFGKMVGDKRQGLAIVAVMGLLLLGSTVLINGAQVAHHGTVPVAVGAATEGTETRFGVPDSATFAAATTVTSTGAVDSFHDSYTSLGGAVTLLDMMYGEVAPGGTGSGLYGILVLAILSVFIAGLMVGRTPEYLGKKIGGREVKFASLYILTTPAIVLTGTAIAMALPGERASMENSGPHGLSEVLYAFTSAGNNNGSAFAGISVNTTWYNTALGIAMLLGRFLPIIFVLGLAGSLASQKPVPVTEGTLPTHRLQFVGFLTGVTVIVVALTYLPALALGPLAEGLHR